MGAHSTHLYISVLPAAAMACLGIAAAVELLALGSASPRARLILVALAVGAVAVMGAAVFGADTATRRERQASRGPAADGEEAQRQLGELGFLINRGRQELQGLMERIAAGKTPPPRAADPRPTPTGDPFVYLARELRRAQNESWNAVVKAASAQPGGSSAQRVEVFVNLARRMQSLSHRAIQGLDELENQVEDPDLLKGLFKVDHLSTRMRRQAESLAVIGGAVSRRQWSRPVTMYEVLRSAIAEIEHYNRVKVVPPVEGTLDGGAVADVIHLLAELIENATKFAPPHTQVFLRAEPVTAGLAIEIEDRGLGMPRETQHRLNDLLADLERIDLDELLRDGRIGLLVVSALSRRHNVAVRLQTNVYGGTQAVVVIPNELIGSEQRETNARTETPMPAAEPVPALSYGGASAHATTPIPRDVEPAGAHDAQPAAVRPRPERRADERSDEKLDGQRPKLPKRHAQTNLVPELLSAPATPGEDAEAEHTPGLMAAFKQGIRSGQEEDATGAAGTTD